MRNVMLPDGSTVPALGQGTWRLGEDPRRRPEELAAVRTGVDLGMRVIDTAEMYGDGATELFLGEALSGLRDKVFLVSKAYPQNAGRARLATACENSLKRLGTDRLDLYLLHWRGRIPLSETVAAMQGLVEAGKIRMWGVSNLDVDDMDELIAAGGAACATNQILFNLTQRGAEYDLLPWLAARAIPFMAYSPVEQGRLAGNPVLRRPAERLGVTPLQLALAWVLQRPDAIVIPKAGTVAHVRQNHAAAAIEIDPETRKALESAFPSPRTKTPLAML